MLSVADRKFMHTAWNMARDSPCTRAQHGCIAVANGKVIGRGVNTYRTQSRDGLLAGMCSCHAEVAAVRQVISQYGQKGGRWEHSIKGTVRAGSA
jgi:deoxycytidylate deaminase